MKTLMPAMDAETDVDDAIGDPSRDNDNETRKRWRTATSPIWKRRTCR